MFPLVPMDSSLSKRLLCAGSKRQGLKQWIELSELDSVAVETGRDVYK